MLGASLLTHTVAGGSHGSQLAILERLSTWRVWPQPLPNTVPPEVEHPNSRRVRGRKQEGSAVTLAERQICLK